MASLETFLEAYCDRQADRQTEEKAKGFELPLCPKIDTNSAVVYQGAQDRWFRFSVAAYRDQDTGW